MSRISVDFSKNIGKIKPYNAVNNGPVSRRDVSNIDTWRALGIPFGRLHDTSYVDEWLVDVHRVFPDFDADENDPKNYIFAPTDAYLARMFTAGTVPYYRLGASIEHSHKKGTHPPKDFEKWERICEHIIMHYTEGWADGFTYDIRYWEIWNEPDNYNPTGNPCWQSTPEVFFEFFAAVLPPLQKRFPHLKIGGPAIATVNHDKWCDDFFAYIKARGLRPDFISYHRYGKTPEDFVEYVRRANAIFEKYGYGDVETHINEWNYVRGWRDEAFAHSVESIKGLKGAAFAASVLCSLHPEKLDMMMYYDGRLSVWCGLYDTDLLKPLKTYHVFSAFKVLADLGTAVKSTVSDDHVYSLAATDGKSGAVLLTHFDELDGAEGRDVTLTLSALPENARLEIYLLDEKNDLALKEIACCKGHEASLSLSLSPYNSYLIKFASA